jgi:hypothetical protein
MRRIAPRPHEVTVVPAAADHHMCDPERERAVGARAKAQPKIGLFGKPDVARIDDDELHPTLERRDCRRRVRQARIGRVVAPKDQATAVSDVRHSPAAASGGDARDPERIACGKASAPAAHVESPYEVRRAEGVHQPTQERRRIADRGGRGRRLTERYARWSVRCREPSHRCRCRVQRLIPGDLHPTRIGRALRPGAAQGSGEPVLAVDQLRRGATLGAKCLAGRMGGVGIEARKTPILDAGDAAAAGNAETAKAGDLESRCHAHGSLPCLGANLPHPPGPRCQHGAAFSVSSHQQNRRQLKDAKGADEGFRWVARHGACSPNALRKKQAKSMLRCEHFRAKAAS